MDWRRPGDKPLSEPVMVRSPTHICVARPQWVNTLRPRQDGHHFPDDIFRCIFVNEKFYILIKISLKFVPTGPNNNIPSLFQIMAWRWSGDKPLSETMVISWLTHICVTRPQWVNTHPNHRLAGEIRCAKNNMAYTVNVMNMTIYEWWSTLFRDSLQHIVEICSFNTLVEKNMNNMLHTKDIIFRISLYIRTTEFLFQRG